MSDRINRLESTVLELGTELFRLRNELEQMNDFRDQFVGVMKGLKHMLDEKGLITLEDFDAAIDFGEIFEQFHSSQEGTLELEHELTKKNSH